jgi:hypothetical protein
LSSSVGLRGLKINLIKVAIVAGEKAYVRALRKTLFPSWNSCRHFCSGTLKVTFPGPLGTLAQLPVLIGLPANHCAHV